MRKLSSLVTAGFNKKETRELTFRRYALTPTLCQRERETHPAILRLAD